MQLGVNYGMGVPSLAKGLNQHPLIASNLIEQHRRKHRRFWHWRDDQLQIAMLDRRIESVFGWPLHISHSPNKRTLYNFPMQSGGAEMLRLAAMRLCDAGVVPIMLVHDGILFEMDGEEQVAQAVEVMRGAGRVSVFAGEDAATVATSDFPLDAGLGLATIARLGLGGRSRTPATGSSEDRGAARRGSPCQGESPSRPV